MTIAESISSFLSFIVIYSGDEPLLGKYLPPEAALTRLDRRARQASLPVRNSVSNRAARNQFR
ncbi:hypothetical protein CUJ84_Chr002240 [Rhizobium leguminosarum]|uniref:Uncharacterized protein n=1 Tax=Rhizobium leguminosarum TaxID=384 RepID=A0A2K9Z3B4_RHILE|nr:hypothetical protein CUJ84_Chr002240 [Rhizobium leguminosarum]